MSNYYKNVIIYIWDEEKYLRKEWCLDTRRRKRCSEFKIRYGAKKDSYFSHIAIEVPGENTSNEWCEPVTDEEYDKLN